MRKTVLFGVTAALAVCLLAGVAAAADAKKDGVCKTPDVIGKYIKNRDGVYLGHVEDVVVDLRDGRVIYCAMTYGDTLGFGGKMFALPPGVLKPSDDRRHLVLDADKEEFERMEGFDANRWPASADNRWKADRKDRKTTTTTETRKEDIREDGKGPMLRRVSSLTGLGVKNERGEDLGRIQGFAVDENNHRVGYAVLAYGGVAGIGTKYFAIPWEALQVKSLSLRLQDRAFVLDADKQHFANSPGFDWNSWPAKGDEHFMKGKKPA